MWTCVEFDETSHRVFRFAKYLKQLFCQISLKVYHPISFIVYHPISFIVYQSISSNVYHPISIECVPLDA